MRRDETVAIDVLRRAGLSHQGVLGSGVEGTVVDLGDGTVAKVWSGRTVADLTALAEFYDAVLQRRRGASAVAMPHILDVRDVGGTPVTVERRLSGDPVWRPDGTSPAPKASEVDAIIDALAALADIPGDPAFRTLPMLADEPAFDPTTPFELELAALVVRRAERFSAPLRAALPDLEALVADTVTALHGLDPATPTLIHGDLVAGNVLTSGTHATAVLDFGFMSTSGDPAFDAALAASIFDMWGPRAREVERTLDRALASAFEHDHRRYSIYRAAYALTTACCFGTELTEGHFAWCIAMASRPDVRDELRG
jgi:aminoglycoside phosphotransferase (APT) family kinase protein